MDAWRSGADPVPGDPVGTGIESSGLADGAPQPDGLHPGTEPAAAGPMSMSRPGVETLAGSNRGCRRSISSCEPTTVGPTSRRKRSRFQAPLYVQHLSAVSHIGTTAIPGRAAYTVRLSEDERWLVVAVADGLGSCANSHEGSELAARLAARFVCRTVAESDLVGVDWRRLFDAVSAHLGDRARRLADASVDRAGRPTLEHSRTPSSPCRRR